VKNPILDVQKTKTVANQDTIHYKTHNILQKQNKPTILSTIKNKTIHTNPKKTRTLSTKQTTHRAKKKTHQSTNNQHISKQKQIVGHLQCNFQDSKE
jgi:hypothetical protein